MTPLPRLAVLTDRAQAARPLEDVVRAAVDAGCRMVVLREKDLPRTERAALAAQLAPLLHERGGVLVSAGERLPGCDGVHLARPARDQPPAPPDIGIVGRSCHDRAELLAAERMPPGDVHVQRYVTVSPIFASSSKPGYGPPLETDGLAELAAATSLPVFALGGVESRARAEACVAAGAHGVAVMGAVMRASDPGAVTAALLQAAGAVPR